MTEQKFGHIAREAVKHPYVIRDRHVDTQHPQRKGLYEGNSRNGVICLSERIFSMNMGRTARNLRAVLLMNPLVYIRLAL